MSELIGIAESYPAIVWAGVGVALLIVEILMVGGFFLSFAAAAFVVALASWLHVLNAAPLWQLVLFAALGVALTPLSRRLIVRYFDRTPDINQY